VVLASGSVPRTIPGFGVDGRLVLTSDEVLSLETAPASVAIIGGGAIGCEFASMFCDLGSQVTVLEALPSLLTGCDEDVVSVVSRSFRKRGIAVHTGVKVTGHTPNGSGTTVQFGDGQEVAVDAVIVSVGRRPLTAGLVAEGTGVVVDERGFVEVDEFMRTAADGVWAAGDVVDTPQLAHVGFAEGIVTIKGILGEPVVPVEYSRVPWCIYCHPEVAFAGLTEAQATEAGLEVVVKKDPFGGNSRARIVGETDGLVKVVAEKTADGKAQFIQPHPTFSESFGETVLALTGRGLHLG
jgi:dihydrolipoamide dehydrogenase